MADIASTRSRARGGGPTHHAPRRPLFIGELLIVVLLVFAYDRIRDLATTHPHQSVTNGRDLLNWERLAHIDIELPFNAWLSGHNSVAELASWYYQLAHLTVTLLVLLACYALRPDAYRPARNALLAINAIGLAVFWLYPVAPPRLLPGAGFVDTAVVTGAASASAASNPYAAMPSLHIAWAVWTGLVALLVVRGRYPRMVWAAYPILTTVVVIGTANHYVLDVVAGLAVAMVAVITPFSGPSLLRLVRSPERSPVEDDARRPEPELAA
jgi:hypothetical protein